MNIHTPVISFGQISCSAIILSQPQIFNFTLGIDCLALASCGKVSFQPRSFEVHHKTSDTDKR